jgi:hypothetical protein
MNTQKNAQMKHLLMKTVFSMFTPMVLTSI